MRHVTFVSCICGIKYKTVIEKSEPDPNPLIDFNCPECEHTFQVEGKIISVHAEVQPEQWRTVSV